MKNLFYIIISLFVLSACDRESFDYNKTDENDTNKASVELNMKSLRLSVDKEITRSGDSDTDNFLVRVFDVNNTDTLEWMYKDMPEIITLKVGFYTIEALSHIQYEAQWDAPFYYAMKTFQLEEDKITEIGTLVCKLSNILVSVVLDEKLKDYIRDDAKVYIRVGNGHLNYAFDEERQGCFIAEQENNTLTAEFSGTSLTGQALELSGKVFENVKAGEHRIVKFVLNETGTDPGEGEEVDGWGDLNISVDATCEKVGVDVEVNPGEETIIKPGEGGDETPDPDKSAPVIEGDGFDINTSVIIPCGTSKVVKVNISSETGLKNLKVLINSETITEEVLTDVGLSKSFDLAYPGALEAGLKGLGFPTGAEVIGAKEITFDITDFTMILGAYGPANHEFEITAIDENGDTVRILNLISQ